MSFSYARLLVRLASRRLVTNLGGHAGFLLIGAVLAAIVAQVLAASYAASSSEVTAASTDPTTGAVVLLVLAAAGAMGPFSTRFPHTPADVFWVHTAPLSMRAAVLTVLVHRCLVRALIWGVASLVMQAALLVGGAAPFEIGRVLVGQVVVLCAFTLWSGAGAACRGSRPRTALVLVLSGILALIGLLGVLRQVVGSLPGPLVGLIEGPGAIVAALGGVLYGDLSLIGLGLVSLIVAASVAIAWSIGMRAREQLVLDAMFWFDFDPRAMMGTRRKVPSWRGGSRLTGPAALLWFELAILRRGRFNWVSLLVLVALSMITTSFDVRLLATIPFFMAVSIVLTGATGGLAAHLRLRTFDAVPGSVVQRVIASESAHILQALLGVVLVLIPTAAFVQWTGQPTLSGLAPCPSGGCPVPDSPPLEQAIGLLPQTVALVAVAAAVRVLGAALTVSSDPVSRYRSVAIGLTAAGLGAAMLLAGLTVAGGWLGWANDSMLVAAGLTAVVTFLAGLIVLRRSVSTESPHPTMAQLDSDDVTTGA